MFHGHSQVLWECHSAVLPTFRKSSLEYATQALEWLRSNTNAKCLMTYVPEGNMRAAHLAEAMGFIQSGSLPKSFAKDGTLINQLIYSREV